MSETKSVFVDRSGYVTPKLDLWPSIVITKEEIDAEVEPACEPPAPREWPAPLAYRSSRRKRHRAGPGNPASRSTCCSRASAPSPIRHNSSQVNFCIRGRGHGGGQRQAESTSASYDVWNTPSLDVVRAFQRQRRPAGAADLPQRRAAGEDERRISSTKIRPPKRSRAQAPAGEHRRAPRQSVRHFRARTTTAPTCSPTKS